MAIELWLRRRKKKGVFLTLLSYGYGVGIAVRHWLYNRGIFSTAKSSLPVVSVGNITAGGSGKTPFVAYLTTLFAKKSKVAILSRGYRSLAEIRREPTLVREGALLPWQVCGDEPYLLARRFRSAHVIVGKHRTRAAVLAKQKGCDLILLDDGMQHRKLHRDVEIVVVEGKQPFGGGHFLPKGRLRDAPKRIEKADLVVINGAISTENRERLQRATKAPLVEGEMVVTRVRNRKGEEVDLEGQEVALFCALGSPDRFVSAVRSLGANVVETSFLPDHRAFTTEEIVDLSTRAHYLCCSEKDGVKLPAVGGLNDRIVVVEGEFVITKNQEGVEELIKRIENLAKGKR